MITSNDFRPGVTIEIDGQVWQVVEFQHVKPGKGAAFVRAKIKNLETGSVVERTWNAGEKVQEGHVDRRQMQYLYEMKACTASWITKRTNKSNWLRIASVQLSTS